jgi:Flp pilus assembly pilin Flp
MRFVKDRRGAVTSEHALVLAIVGTLLIIGLLQFRTTLENALGGASSNVEAARVEPSILVKDEEPAPLTATRRDGLLVADERGRASTN